jgi:precorrin-2 dehydrogenase / sirohydrochlorin ferrochelatase
MPNYYPIMLDVRHRPALIIGGDRIAAEKAAALQASGANVTIMHPTFGAEVLALHEQNNITLRQKAYEPGDLAGAFVIIAATNDKPLIEALWTEAQERKQLLNIVDVPSHCAFIIPSILRRDQLTIAVSTEGASPSLAKRIRHKLEALFPPAYGTYLRLASVVRSHMRKQGLSYDRRDDFFGDYYASDVLSQLEQGNHAEAVAITSELLERYDVTVPTATITTDMKEAG